MQPTRIDRRTFLQRSARLAGLAGAGLATGGLGLGCAADAGSPYEPYFADLNALLRAEGPGSPLLLIDLDRLDHNLDALRRAVGPDKTYRIVVKSLPSIELLRYAMARTSTNALMAFHQPFLNAIADAFPHADVLLGKPLPAAAVRRFYGELAPDSGFAPESQLNWLLDTEARTRDYLAIARALGVRLRVAAELDIGGHRGHIQTHDQLRSILAIVSENPDHFVFGGYMGYDAYAAGFPDGWRASLLARSVERYVSFTEVVRTEFAALDHPALTRNGGGSKTVGLYSDEDRLNDLAAGSAAVMPSDFDVDTLADHVPAAFIATPILKHREGLDLPVLPWVGRVMQAYDPNRAQSWFVYGGNWKAHYHAPAGLQLNPIYGRSSNSEMINGSNRIELGVDDHVFLRPTQSEAVLLQFGALWAIRGNRLEARWPILAPS